MLSRIATLISKFTSTKLWYYIENILVVVLLFYCIKSLTDYDNVYYQTWKNTAAAKAILAFTAIVFIIRKVKLLNWQSLVATLLFGIVVFERLHFWADAEDILNAVKPQLAAEWLSLMIIIDMILYKNVSNIFKGVNYLAILYVLMTIGMILRRHDRMDPIVLIFPMLLFALVKMDEERSDWFIRRFIDSWFISFIYIMVRSFIERPYEGYRYYGCFLNIGQFGIFMVCCFTVAIASIYYCREKYGRKNIGYSIGIVWLLTIVYMFYLIDTRTILIGVLFCLITLYIFVRKITTSKSIFKRMMIVLIVFIGMFGSLLLILNYCTAIPDEWIYSHYSGPLSPIATTIMRLKISNAKTSTLPTNERFYTLINLLSSGRFDIFKGYSQYFNYDGNSTIGFELEATNYWVYTAHNTYVQFLVEYGYISLFELLVVIIYAIYSSIKSYYLSLKQPKNVFPILWFASMIGVWFGESNTFFFPITFFGFMFIARLLPSIEQGAK